MDKIANLFKSPWVPVVLGVLQFVLGVGTDQPFTDFESFRVWITGHAGLTGASVLVLYGIWYAAKQAKESLSGRIIAKNLEGGGIHIQEVVEAVRESAGVQAAELVKSAAADAAWVTVLHVSEADQDLMDKTCEAHNAYRRYRVVRAKDVVETTATTK